MARLGCTVGILIPLSIEKEKYVNLKIEKKSGFILSAGKSYHR